ncbi:MAG: metallophosphoesterase family protein [Aureispira sp.]
MKVVLLSDTHSYLDPNILPYLEACDEIWHAGDIGNLYVADQLEAIAPLRAVYGNIDGHELRIRYPKEWKTTIGGLSIYMIHIGGYPGRYPKALKATLERLRPDLFICGHSHILKVMRDKKLGTLHLNPGACGRHGFHRVKTFLQFEIKNGKLENLQAVELGLRGKIEEETS